ncbi:MAG: dihydrofolate reductase family protein [Pseudonocardiaceae bacterium]
MTSRPYVLLSVAASVDGYIDDATGTRLLLSNDADVDRVDEVRAGCDAILVGANTIRRDDPRLLVRSPERQQQRRRRGRPAHPTKVTLTASGDVDPTARFFTAGDTERLVYAPTPITGTLRGRLGAAATVVGAGEPLDLHAVLADLADRKVERLMVEGGGTVHTHFLTAGVVDEIHLVIAPVFVGDPNAPRFVGTGTFPQNSGNPMVLAETRQLGDVVLLRYLPRQDRDDRDVTVRDRQRLAWAIELAERCPPSATAFSVGAVITGPDGSILATGFSRENDPHDHAEEAALAKLGTDDPRLAQATLYSSLEPCSTRASRPRSCTDLILATAIPRIVFAWREPALFVVCEGAELLRAAGREVVEISDLSGLVRRTNAHLLGS